MSDWKAAGRKERREDGAGKRPERGRRDDEAGGERVKKLRVKGMGRGR